MKIAIDIRSALGKRLGKGVYTYELVSHLLDIDQQNEYLLLTDRDLNDETQKAFVRKNTEVWKGSLGPLWHFKARKKNLDSKIDIFFSPTSFITPAILPSSIRSVVVVHDLVAFLFPTKHQIKATVLEKIFLKRSLKKAASIVVVSENTKKDLVKFFPFVESKPIHVIYPAASKVFSETVSAEEFEEFRKGKNLPANFFLAVGTLEPRKNLEILLKAMEKLGAKALPLVIVGSEGWKNEHLMKKIKSMGQKVILLPYLPEKDLAKMYRLATVFIFPSLYEGFGIPPLEAMAMGLPVIASNTSALPEVCGDAALYFGQNDATKLAEHMKNVAENKTLRKELGHKGLIQTKKFSWQKSAQELLQNVLKP